ncbi:hypothetical protein PP175_25365 (plasmid) [Aneurinibacillus sp. Ricciae_BoGa-3]|nr:hypothetical protein [Aneurinibacillus sp. Ricciae_BoGa-3]WCK57399.1 hypothetical protein PP175_25365 [Aneurinibacillus sp. Ricciae_BoGa-3]
MKNILLIVDMEEKYLTDDDYMGLMHSDSWEEVRQDLKNGYMHIIERTG